MTAMVQISPLIPSVYLALLLLTAALLVILALRKRIFDLFFRALFFVILIIVLLNPVIVNEVRKPLTEKLVVVVDESPSNNIGNRHEITERALNDIKASFKKIETVVIRAGNDFISRKNQNTSLFTSLRNNLMGIPQNQVVGSVIITDGQVHDVPDDISWLEKLTPVNVILTGNRNEFDYQVNIVEAPRYALLNDVFDIKIKVDGIGNGLVKSKDLTVYQDGKKIAKYNIDIGSVNKYQFKADHAGKNVFEFSISDEKNELTKINNKAATVVNGIRDRLKVLLVSGAPHMGERAWRNLLKSDPAIDLVHFTILRSPVSFNNVPANEMSLIVFPVNELFENKIKEFDLIVFDKYMRYNLLDNRYFSNIAEFVKGGGALLMAMGSDGSEQMIFNTPLAEVLPVSFNSNQGSLLLEEYSPKLTEVGKMSPITADLYSKNKKWGKWFSQTLIKQNKGDVLMVGIDDSPLLVVDNVEKGRVAVLGSDNIWLWAKGAETLGPYNKLLRNIAHWLMHEPELEKDYIKTVVNDNVITIAKHNFSNSNNNVKMVSPDGAEEQIELLNSDDEGWLNAEVIVGQSGLYSFYNGENKSFAVVGNNDSTENLDVYATAKKVESLVKSSRGSIVWAENKKHISLLNMKLKRNKAYSVIGIEGKNLIPAGIAVFFIFAGFVYVWRKESF